MEIDSYVSIALNEAQKRAKRCAVTSAQLSKVAATHKAKKKISKSQHHSTGDPNMQTRASNGARIFRRNGSAHNRPFKTTFVKIHIKAEATEICKLQNSHECRSSLLLPAAAVHSLLG